jgi:Protein of unknown function (DUF3987)
MTSNLDLYRGPTGTNLDEIPDALKAWDQWILWRGQDRIDAHTGEVKFNKIPIDPQALTATDITDPLSWGTFDYCIAALPAALEAWEYDNPGAFRGGGLGFVLTPDDPYTGADFDHCVDATTGIIADWAQRHIDALNTYTEVTPSGTGLRAFLLGTLPSFGRKKGHVEMYTDLRFLTVTGWRLDTHPSTIEARQPQINALWASLFGAQVGQSVWIHDAAGSITNVDGKPWVIERLAATAEGEPYAFFRETATGIPLVQCVVAPPELPAGPLVQVDDALIQAKALAAKNGPKVSALGLGHWQQQGYDSPSQADLALCMLLAFWTRDAAQIDRLFRTTQLMRPKWDERRGAQTYGARTIREALARQHEAYAWPVHLVTTPPWTLQGEGYARRNGHVPGPEPTDPYACPALPAYASIQEARAQDASRFLNDYIDLSRTWAPRAYDGFHEAVAVFLLATIAAHRIKLLFGPRGGYTSLYIALAARTTMYTKSTAADIGLALLDAAELSWLLADDDATPQAFLRSLSLYVPSDYADAAPEEQERIRRQLAFSGQRGWFYEEWGQHLEAMMQKNGYMASFRNILKRLDDHKVRYTSSTIGRGRDILRKPYISLLANVTPSDLQPFVKAHAPLWRDGYIARVAFVAPEVTSDADEGSDAEFPEELLTIPSSLVKTLQNWHKRLGIPTCRLTPQQEKKGKATGSYNIAVSPLPEKAYTLHADVRRAYYAYDRAIRELTRQRHDEDLDGSYGRFPVKALRIAGLLASLHDDGDTYTIWPRHWDRGQQITEGWRRDLHRLVRQVQTQEKPMNAKRDLEDKLLHQVDRSGPQSIRGFALFQKAQSREEIEACVTALVATGELIAQPTAQTTKYGRPTEAGQKV